MENNIVVGLDIGTTKIAVVVGREDEKGKIEILGYSSTESLGVKRGLVTNIKQTVDSINEAIEKATENSGVHIEDVYVGIAGQYVKSILHRSTKIKDKAEGAEITKQDIEDFTEKERNIAVDPGEMIISVIPQEYIIDGEPGIKNPVGMIGTTIDTNFHIITAQIAAAENIRKCVNGAGLNIKYILLEPIASADAVLVEEEKEAGVALVDIGGGTTDIAIFHDGILRHTAVIPFGGDIITEDIKEGCKILKKYAEDLKIKFGSAISLSGKDEDSMVSIPGIKGRQPKEISIKNLSSIIQARMDEILKYVYFNIQLSGYEKKLIAGIVLTGGGSLLKDIQQLTQYRTGMDTRIGYPNEYLSSNTPKELNSPVFSTAIGLVKIGIELSKKENQNNDNKKQPKKKGKIYDLFSKLSDKLTSEP